MASKKDAGTKKKPGSPRGSRAPRVSTPAPEMPVGKGGKLAKSEHREEREAALKELDSEVRGPTQVGPKVEVRQEPQPHGGSLTRSKDQGNEKQAKMAAEEGRRVMREMPNGSKLLSGNPGNKGGTGRPSNEWRDKMAQLGNDPVAMAYLRRCLRGKLGPQAAVAAYKYVTEQAHGKATLRAEIQGGDKPVSVIIRKE